MNSIVSYTPTRNRDFSPAILKRTTGLKSRFRQYYTKEMRIES